MPYLLKKLGKLPKSESRLAPMQRWSKDFGSLTTRYTPHGIKLSFSVVEKSSTCALVRYIEKILHAGIIAQHSQGTLKNRRANLKIFADDLENFLGFGCHTVCSSVNLILSKGVTTCFK
jgi:hypothetical protein